MPNEKLEVRKALKAARTSFDENRDLIIRLTAAFAVLSGASALLDFADPAGEAISIGLTILIGASYGGIITAIICLPGKSARVADLWATVKPVLARLIWVTLLTGVLVVAGTFALIVPGLILITMLSVSGQAVVVERRKVLDSLSRSFNLVKGDGWSVFGFLLVIGLLTLLVTALVLLVAAPLGGGVLAGVLIAFLSGLLINPIFAIGSAALYNELIRVERSGQAQETPAEPL